MAAAFYNFPASYSLFSHKLFFSSSLPLPNSRINLRHRCTVFSCSVKKPSTRTRRKVKSNDELCNDIREFLTSAGLPEHHVPSTKELSQHGRQDLANIVRRRGYKFMKQLLQTSPTENIDTFQSEKVEVLSEYEGQKEKWNSLANNILPSEATQEGEIHGRKETHGDLKPNVKSSLISESTALTLEEKVARFIQHGKLDTLEDSGLGAVYDRYGDEAERDVESDDAHEPELPLNYPQPKDLSLCSSSGTEPLNGKASFPAMKVEDPVLEKRNSSYVSTEECTSVDPDKDLDAESMENQAEIKRLKFMLHQKEMELTQLKQQIEKEKLALSVLQATAETEISKARKLVSEKETELHAAEESLSGLKEVEIQYSGEGETVELAGSFNGWHQKIPMDRHSSTTEPTGSRTSRLWKAVLWLYPGVYEIKFVVDGHWRIDPERELTTRGSFNNNILRVDR